MNLEEVVEPLGPTRVKIGDWAKEPDESWSARGAVTTVLKVGPSEPDRMLSLNARSWLASMSTRYRASSGKD